MRVETIRTYWRNNDNPFPGRLISVKYRKLNPRENAWLDYVRRCREAQLEQELAAKDISNQQFENLVDQACEVLP